MVLPTQVPTMIEPSWEMPWVKTLPCRPPGAGPMKFPPPPLTQ